MSILSDLFALIGPVMNGRAYRSAAPDTPTAPYATFFRVASTEGNTLDDNGGTGNESSTRIQIDIYGSAADIDAKALAVKAALKSWHIPNVINLDLDGYEPEVKLHRVTLDISTWHQ
jgi:hypothetical protein